ncbi:phenylalanine--tRNA ligase subunit beta [Alkalihalophilus marmarensis]|uniref:Phenylalanine--tRNA ligase beta subunit n=1 Tax=Alkalihalophilus marmarensis DSM 21297 TaxID=1188261 RepID=U6SLM5_9BACI|nr:phenylalanine--tRNA ligase subunit beta [Alkalihalophilus marmarensis]ERN52488.1 phenylalanyl-tRNA synthase subunit beta [Alkalihalophilus marmarensis DSM 21297]MCM3487820.1 phenylalanine--tRNA ligase subunit beta [Alkalihalophilus marmarensis]
MLVSYKWLQDYVKVDDVTPKEIAEKMTRGGIEIDFVHELNQGVRGVVVGYVRSCEQHPNADKLNVCQVDIGEEEPVQIVCGAKNIAAGQYVAVAKVGAVLPGNFKIKKAKLRGEASHGMICSLQELGIESKLVHKDFAEGIYVFKEEVEVGADALALLNLDDTVLELDLTPNRSDCLNMLGVAYEVAALYDREVELPAVSLHTNDEHASDYIDVNVENTDDNPYYGATIIKDVKVGPSPLWLQNRLTAAGIRPISNVVDITNYVLLEYGQPLHAFDYDKFGSKEVVVRRAREGEKMITLDETERALSTDHLLITNGEKPMAIAGVMGGQTSEVSDETTTILLEAAYFNPAAVRKASRDLGLRSDSSARFEKGVDPSRVKAAGERAAALIAELCDGTIVSGVVESDQLNREEVQVHLNLPRMNNRLGTDISKADVERIFNRLQFTYEDQGETLVISAPTRRGDIQIEEDLFEEVARLYGYDTIPTTLPVGATTQGALTPYQAKRRRVRRYLESVGLTQAITYSLTSPKKAEGFAEESPAESAVRLAMPMSEDRSTMRTSLIPHLFDVLTYNLNRKNQDLHLYEVGSIFTSEEKVLTKQPVEREMVAAAFTGLWLEHPWQAEKKPVDFFVVKGIVEGLFAELGLEDHVSFKQVKRPKMHPGRTAVIMVNDVEAGFIGQVHPSTEKEEDLRETYVFQLDLEMLLNVDVEDVVYQGLPRFPSIQRDIALVVNSEVQAGEVEKVISQTGGSLLRSVQLFDLYQGEHMEEGKKSLAFSLTYLDPEKTLTDEDVTLVHEKVLEELQAQIGASLRS